MSQPLLEGHFVEAEETAPLHRKIAKLEAELDTARRDAQVWRAKFQKAARSQEAIKEQLEPWYNALRNLFEEMEDVSVGEKPSNSKTAAVWESWKNKFGGGTAKVIDALMLHGEMNTTQLSIATGLHRTTIPALIFKLNQASLINKNGGKFSLKEL